ncbi:hypothetical protein [Paenibacillus planticolens]|uniref:HNH endonuclease n=1 Tax=Paenibacillus planticolens TaxID=2654976 RepID=A0ABX1ZL65_9BACL|nr:hypothetical protein [Paenibacillus planticolens]NOU99493.1 hypothetical protein [Paenibacillus planticolens]
MIRIGIEQAKLDQLVSRHKAYFSKNLMNKRLEVHFKTAELDIPTFPSTKQDYMSKKYIRFFSYLRLKMDDILAGEPKKLQDIIDHIETNYRDLPFRSFSEIDGNVKKKAEKEKQADENKEDEGKETKQSNLFRSLTKIFNYTTFTKSGVWCAYDLALGLRLSICPYCNRQYIHSHQDETLKIRATLDHFYDKGTYPFLALSFYNLIPSCYFCNSILKHKKAFSINTHLHPYLHGFEDDIQFYVKFRGQQGAKLDYTSILRADPETFSLGFRFRKGSDLTIKKKAGHNIHDFKLKELYKVHKDYISEIIHKSVVYNDDFIQGLFRSHPRLFTSEEEISRMVLGNYIQPQSQDRRVLSKLTRDVAIQLGLAQKLVFPNYYKVLRRRK